MMLYCYISLLIIFSISFGILSWSDVKRNIHKKRTIILASILVGIAWPIVVIAIVVLILLILYIAYNKSELLATKQTKL